MKNYLVNYADLDNCNRVIPDIVVEGLFSFIRNYRDFQDSVLCVLEVPIAFPSGFYF